MANWWDAAPKADSFDVALSQEGLTGPAADIARSIYAQESSSGKNTRTSNAGAVGGMQIIPSTFKSVADKDWDINDPVQNSRAGIRYVKQLYQQAGGDPSLTASGYYGGPGGLEKARRGVAVSDPRNPNAPDTLQYGQQVAARIGKQPGMVQSAVEAVIPSANAEPAPSGGDWWASAPIAEQPSKEAIPRVEVRGTSADEPSLNDRFLQGAGNVGAGLIRGAGSIGATLLAPVDAAARAMGVQNDYIGRTDRRQAMDAGLQELGADPNSIAYGAGKLGGEIAGTAGVGSVVAAPLRAAATLAPAGNATNVLARLAQAAQTGGMSAGTGAAGAGGMAARIAGGALTGGASAGLVDPESAGTGAAIGGALPPALGLVGAAGRTAGALVRPFYESGQRRIVGDTLREFASNPQAARSALSGAAEVVPGSAPIAATAAGDDGIAALSRAMQNASPEYASNLAARQTAQNQARTAALEGIAGNTGKIDVAKAARDSLTSPMREQVLEAAGNVPADRMLGAIDRLISNPNNAGKLSQQALNEFRGRIAQFSEDGSINARALYEIRKDINTLQQGKLQGEAGNLRYASSQLTGLKNIIDDAIDEASRRVPPGAAGAAPSASREVSAFTPSTELGQVRGSAVGPASPVQSAAPGGAQGARPSWRGYLQTYANESIPINQMQKLDEILKSVQTGTVDSQGGAILSAAKLNNVLKNQGSDLVKELSPEQLRILRAVQADLNAGQIANNTGRAVGSNTLQNIAQNQLLQSSLGNAIGGSNAARSTLGRLLQLPYGTANQQIQEQLGNALLNPRTAAQLMQDPATNRLLQSLRGVEQLGYRAAPVLTSQ